jgi:2-methylisocitrate lyase-like PEP mutase family enzyme
MKKTTQLRYILAGDQVLLAPFTYDAFAARIGEEVGFSSIYMSGFGVSMSKGVPDIGLLTQTEMIENATYIAQSVNVPVIADADTAYGNPLNAWRTVRDYERSGVAGIHIEDQVAPKRCGFFEGKDVISKEEGVQKIRAAVDAKTDSDFVIIARSDALVVNGWEDTAERCRAYYEAGADLVFVDGIQGIKDLETYAAILDDIPRMYNGELPVSESQRLGFKIQIHRGPMFSLHTAITGFMSELLNTGVMAEYADGNGSILRKAITRTLDLDGFQDMERRYVTQ